MTEPWPVTYSGSEGWSVLHPHLGHTWFATEPEARRYAATPLLIEAVKDGLRVMHHDDLRFWVACGYCGAEETIPDWIKHAPDCLGIAALRAAGEIV